MGWGGGNTGHGNNTFGKWNISRDVVMLRSMANMGQLALVGIKDALHSETRKEMTVL